MPSSAESAAQHQVPAVDELWGIMVTEVDNECRPDLLLLAAVHVALRRRN